MTTIILIIVVFFLGMMLREAFFFLLGKLWDIGIYIPVVRIPLGFMVGMPLIGLSDVIGLIILMLGAGLLLGHFFW